MRVGRYYYAPTEAQRAEIELARQVFRRRVRERRIARASLEQFMRIGFPPNASEELAEIYARLTA